MSYPVYYVEAGDTLVHLFSSYDGGTGASLTLTGLAVTDIEIYKDGSVTQRASDAGYTLLDTDGIDFDGLTGIHGFSIDLNDNTDAGFYAVGPWYHVVVSSVTIDAQTVSFIACAFRIVTVTRGLAGTALPNAAADAAGGLPISDAGGLDLDAQIGTDIDAILVDTGTTLDARIPAALVGGRMDASVGAMATGVVTATAIAADAIGASELAADAVDEILDEALADSVPADGSLPTLRQALYMITQFLTERSVSATTVTVKKVDGTTALMTFTLDDATTPTSITRAT